MDDFAIRLKQKKSYTTYLRAAQTNNLILTKTTRSAFAAWLCQEL